jgi:hypothetical protein
MQACVMSHFNIIYIIRMNHKQHTQTDNSVIKWCVDTNIINIIRFVLAEILY